MKLKDKFITIIKYLGLFFFLVLVFVLYLVFGHHDHTINRSGVEDYRIKNATESQLHALEECWFGLVQCTRYTCDPGYIYWSYDNDESNMRSFRCTDGSAVEQVTYEPLLPPDKPLIEGFGHEYIEYQGFMRKFEYLSTDEDIEKALQRVETASQKLEKTTNDGECGRKAGLYVAQKNLEMKQEGRAGTSMYEKFEYGIATYEDLSEKLKGEISPETYTNYNFHDDSKSCFAVLYGNYVIGNKSFYDMGLISFDVNNHPSVVVFSEETSSNKELFVIKYQQYLLTDIDLPASVH